MRVAIYGGSFDPPTVAHRDLIADLSRRFDQVWVVPAAAHPLKPHLSPLAPRMAMLRATVADAHLGPSVKIMPRQEAYTADMLVALRAEHPAAQITLAVGADILAETHKWNRWDEIAATTPIDVTPRAAEGSVSSSEVRRRMAAGQSIDRLVVPAVELMLTGKASQPSGGGWSPVGRSGGFVRRRGGRAEYWYP